MKSFPLREIIAWFIIVVLFGGLTNIYILVYDLKEDFLKQSFMTSEKLTTELAGIKEEIIRVRVRVESLNERKIVVDERYRDHEARIRMLEKTPKKMQDQPSR